MNRRRVLIGMGTLLASTGSGCVTYGRRSQDELPGIWMQMQALYPDGDSTTVAMQMDQLTAPQRHLFATTLETDEPYVTYEYRPFRIREQPRRHAVLSDRTYVNWDGTYYRVTVSESEAESISQLTLRAHQIEPDEAGGAIPWTDYPAVDHGPIDDAIRLEIRQQGVSEEDRRAIPEREWRYVLPDPEAMSEDSDLVPEPAHEYVTGYDRHFRLVVEETTFEGTKFTWNIEEVTADPDGFADYVDAEVVDGSFDTPPLSDAQQAIIDAAMDSRHLEYRPYSDAYLSLADRVGVTIDEGAGHDTLDSSIEVALVVYTSEYWELEYSLLAH